MEFVYIILLGDEYVVDFLESREATQKKAMLKLSRLEEHLYFLAKKNWLLVHVVPYFTYLMTVVTLSVTNLVYFVEIQR